MSGYTANVIAPNGVLWVYNADEHAWKTEPMTYSRFVGGSSRSSDLLRGSFSVTEPGE